LAGGDKAFPKERVEVIGGGKVGVIDDFRALTTCAGGKTRTERMKRNKGHLEELVAWADCVQGRTQSPIGWEELHRTTLASIRAVRCLREGQPFGLEV
jgi:polar amino acid transport system substrate-binding protein